MMKYAAILAMALTMSACSSNAQAKTTDLMDGIQKEQDVAVDLEKLEEDGGSRVGQITELSLNLLQRLDLNENTMISPLSIASALSMTANGACDKTLSQMETVLGSDLKSFNDYLYAYRTYLPTSERYTVKLANSIWYRNDPELKVKEEFLKKNKAFYDADIYKTQFDETTMNEINEWVDQKTDHQITQLLTQPPEKENIMYLINALSFDGEWIKPYSDYKINEGEFTKADGEKQTVKFMNSEEYGYITLPNAVGVEKPYADEAYFFVALLPEEGATVADLINSLDGDSLNQALKNANREKVITSIPKFEFSYDVLLNESLQSLGMTDAFSVDHADFQDMASCGKANISIGKVIHKTKIAVDEKGTKAGAVTSVDMVATTALIMEEPKRVILNRPFLFMIVDNEQRLPLFMGVLNQME